MSASACRQAGRFQLFEVSIEHVTFIRYDPVTEHQHAARWPRAREFIRKTTPTSLAEPEPAVGILVPQ